MQDMIDAVRKTDENKLNESSEYSADIPVSIYSNKEGEEDLSAGNVTVPFVVDYEARSWGLKDITLYLRNDIVVEYDNDETGGSGSVTIPADSIELSFSKGNYWGIDDLDITLGEDGKVQDATLNCTYAAPAGV